VNEPTSWPWVQNELRVVGDRVAASIGKVTDVDAIVPGLDWSTGDLIGHVGIIPFHMRDMMSRREPLVLPETAAGVAAMGAERLSHFDDHSAPAIAARLPREIDTTLTELGEDPDLPAQWYTLQVPVRAVGGIMLSELVVHHLDLTGLPALAADRREVTPDQARACLYGLTMAAPAVTNPDVAAKIPGTYVTRIEGGESFTIQVADGAASVVPGEVGKPDLVTTADPVAMLLASFGRLNPARAALTGKIRTWGRKPWRIPAVANLFRQV